ncbi:unnamed protein product, partial [Ectocarpus sp. 4 AP-2014]
VRVLCCCCCCCSCCYCRLFFFQLLVLLPSFLVCTINRKRRRLQLLALQDTTSQPFFSFLAKNCSACIKEGRYGSTICIPPLGNWLVTTKGIRVRWTSTDIRWY